MARPRGHRLSPAAWQDVLTLRGLSLTQAAELAGVPRATVSGLVGGHQRASVPLTRKLSEALGCSPETLFPTLRSSTFTEAA